MGSVRLLACVLCSLATVMVPPAAHAQDDAPVLVAAIRAGTCDDRAGTIAALDEPALPRGDEDGARRGVSALISDTTVDLVIADLLDDDHIVAVSWDGVSGVVACGGIGGVVTRRDVLTIQVEEVNDSGVWGIASLAPNDRDDNETDVALYLGGPGLDEPPRTDDRDTETETEPVLDGETYVSPNFGFAITWDPDVWEVIEGPTTTADGNDYLALQTFGTTVVIGGVSVSIEAPTCVDALVDGQTQGDDVTNAMPLEIDGIPATGGDERDAYATWSISRTDFAADQAYYARCIVLGPGQILYIEQFAAEVIYAAAAEDRERLLSGLVLP